VVLRVASILGVSELFEEEDPDDFPLTAPQPISHSLSPLIKPAPIPIAGSSDDI